MDKMTLVKWLVAVLMVGALAACGWEDLKLDPKYQEKLDLVVWSREISQHKNAKTRIPSWKIDLNVPDHPPREQWDAVHSQPQIMFKLNNPSTNLYIMNMNGSDIRLIATMEELGGPAAIQGQSRPTRSPNGRYIVTGFHVGFGYGCALIDLKEREVTNLRTGNCREVYWSVDSKSAYFVASYIEGLVRLDVVSKKAKALKLLNELPDGIDYLGDILRFTLSADRSYAVGTLHPDIIAEQPELGRELIFSIPEFKFIERRNYLAEGCDLVHKSLDEKSFTCLSRGENMEYYHVDEPRKVAGISPRKWIIKDKTWSWKESSMMITRMRTDGENSPLPALNYLYRLPKSLEGKINYSGAGLALYLPEHLKPIYHNIDLAQFFPPLPTHAEYQASFVRQLKEQEENKRGQ